MGDVKGPSGAPDPRAAPPSEDVVVIEVSDDSDDDDSAVELLAGQDLRVAEREEALVAQWEGLQASRGSDASRFPSRLLFLYISCYICDRMFTS